MIIRNFSDLSPELIVWEDIACCVETWPSIEEVQTWLSDKADVFVEQVGFVIAEDEKNIVFADSFMESNEVFGNVHKIPKSVLRKRVKLIEQNETI